MTKPHQDRTRSDGRGNRSNRKPAPGDPRRHDRPQLADYDTWVDFQTALAAWEGAK